MSPATLPLRPCVGIALLGRSGRLFAGQRVDNMADAWQMPQGGIDKGESPREAAMRELAEETGLGPTHVELLAEHPEWLDYDLPPELQGRIWGGRYRGQTQRWFLLRMLAADSAVRIDGHDSREFRCWDWLSQEQLMAKVVAFKRPVYARVLEEFGPWIQRDMQASTA